MKIGLLCIGFYMTTMIHMLHPSGFVESGLSSVEKVSPKALQTIFYAVYSTFFMPGTFNFHYWQYVPTALRIGLWSCITYFA